MQIHIERAGEKYGPYSEAEVQKHLASGTLKPTDLAWYKDLSDWVPLATLFPAVSPPAIASSASADNPVPPRPARRFRGVLVIGIVLLAMLAYLASPYFALWRLFQAGESGDQAGLEERIDFPSVRAGLKEDFRVHIERAVAKDKDMQDNPFGGLVSAIATPMLEGMIDSMVTPSGVAALIKEAKTAEAKEGTPSEEAEPGSDEFDLSKLKYAFFTSPTDFLVDVDSVKLRMKLTGTKWKVTRVEVSPEVFESALQ